MRTQKRSKLEIKREGLEKIEYFPMGEMAKQRINPKYSNLRGLSKYTFPAIVYLEPQRIKEIPRNGRCPCHFNCSGIVRKEKEVLRKWKSDRKM